MNSQSVNMPPQVTAAIRKPVNGQGGFQDLLQKLQGQLSSDGSVLTLSDEDIGKIVQYESYKPGGFEERLAPVLDLLRQQGVI